MEDAQRELTSCYKTATLMTEFLLERGQKLSSADSVQKVLDHISQNRNSVAFVSFHQLQDVLGNNIGDHHMVFFRVGDQVHVTQSW